MLVTLKEIINELGENQAVPAFNVYGYEDAKVVLDAASSLRAPAVLMTNRDAVMHMGSRNLCNLLKSISEDYSIPICIHLDHAKSMGEIEEAIKSGYTSVMYDGSSLPLEKNISNTLDVIDFAKNYNVSVEAEIGSVGYSDPNMGSKGKYTELLEAKEFYDKTKVDFLAVAVGTLHRMTGQEAIINYELLTDIEKELDVPLVIHGSTGVKDHDLTKLSHTGVKKVNIGTAVRMTFGNSLKSQFETDEFDRIKLFKKPMKDIERVILKKYRLLGF
ncbi:class II fructose-bisphosphate aldolase family protein [Fusobacteria bacterium ZRK30]|nr:class II fructose-bisphosphate aldolase family protein [Fusobacteria bacterium ZRK30]